MFSTMFKVNKLSFLFLLMIFLKTTKVSCGAVSSDVTQLFVLWQFQPTDIGGRRLGPFKLQTG